MDFQSITSSRKCGAQMDNQRQGTADSTSKRPKFELREMPVTNLASLTYDDLVAFQKKISAGAEMKTAIKRFLDTVEDHESNEHIKRMKEAVEEWTNLW